MKYSHIARDAYIHGRSGCQSEDAEQVKSLAVHHDQRMSISQRIGFRDRQLSVKVKVMA